MTETVEPADVDMLLVRLGEHRLALPLADVEQVLPAMATVPLPAADELVAGVINLHGRPLPVLDVRRRLGLDTRPLRPGDHFVACRVSRRHVALWVDAAESVIRAATHPVTCADGTRSTNPLAGVTVADDGLVLVYELDAFLKGDEVLRVDRLMAVAQAPG